MTLTTQWLLAGVGGTLALVAVAGWVRGRDPADALKQTLNRLPGLVMGAGSLAAGIWVGLVQPWMLHPEWAMALVGLGAVHFDFSVPVFTASALLTAGVAALVEDAAR